MFHGGLWMSQNSFEWKPPICFWLNQTDFRKIGNSKYGFIYHLESIKRFLCVSARAHDTTVSLSDARVSF